MRLALLGRYAQGVVRLRRSDVLIASFPRSGSTLLRFVLTLDALERRGDVSEVTFDRLNRLAPELGAAPLVGPDPFPGEPRWVKTHRPYSRWLARPRALHLVRPPLDALASYHRYWTARLGAASVGRSAFLRDARRGLPRWIAHTRSWQPHADVRVDYEALRADPAATVAEALGVLGLEADPAALARAAARSSAEAVRSVERAHGAAGTDALRAPFVADRPAGEGARYFGPEDVAWALDRLGEAGLWGEAAP